MEPIELSILADVNVSTLEVDAECVAVLPSRDVIMFLKAVDQTVLTIVSTILFAIVTSTIAAFLLSRDNPKKDREVEYPCIEEEEEPAETIQETAALMRQRECDMSVTRKVDVNARIRGKYGGKVFRPSISIPTLNCGFEDVKEDDRDDWEVEDEQGGTREEAEEPSFNCLSKVEKTTEDRKFIENSIFERSDHLIFDALSPDERSQLADAMELVSLNAEDLICRSGDEGDFFYLVKEGIVEVYITSSLDSTKSALSAASSNKARLFSRRRSSEVIQSSGSLLSFSVHSSSCERDHTADSNARSRSRINSQNTTSGELSSRRDSESAFFIESYSPEPTLSRELLPTSRRGSGAITHNEQRKKRESLLSMVSSICERDTPRLGKSSMKTVDLHLCDELGPGDSFGELALMLSCPRSATCIAKTDCKLWRVDRRTFRDIMAGAHSPKGEQTRSKRQMTLDVLKEIPLLSVLDDGALGKLADAALSVQFKKGDAIIIKGEIGHIFYIVTSGYARIHDIGTGDSQRSSLVAGKGDWFGEQALLTGDKRAASVTAESETIELLAFSRKIFEKTLGNLQNLIDSVMRKRQLICIPSFAVSRFEEHELDELANASTKVTFQAGETIIEVGDRAQAALYLIESGCVQIFDEKRNSVNTLSKGCHFGGETLLPCNAPRKSCISEQCIKAVEDTVCAMFTVQAIESVIGDISRLGKPLPPVAARLDKTIKMEDIKRHRVLGIGSFGTVWLVQNKKKPDGIYALKVLSKHKVLERNAVKFVMREKNIMASISAGHPLIVDLVATFQDDKSLFLLQSFIQGGELFTRIQTAWSKGTGLSEDASRFYGACIFESLQHLHKRNIVYRDLKPENVLLDKDGYCILIDMGFARVVLDKAYTMCGTPEYLSPEQILGRGHDRGADDWAFGCVLHELLVGKTPFYQADMTEKALFRRILKGSFPFPDSISKEARKVIKKLLVKDARKRLGYAASGDDDIRRDPWFCGIFEDNKILHKKAKAPYIPIITDPLDASYFEFYSMGEGEDKDCPIRPEEQKQFADFTVPRAPA